jgi:hypothetical protein
MEIIVDLSSHGKLIVKSETHVKLAEVPTS